MTNEGKRTSLGSKLKKSKDLLFGTSEGLPRIIEIDMVKLRPNPEQPRQNFDEETLQSLANSIVQHGLLQPIAVARDAEREEGYIIVAGERRYRAHQLLERDTIPAVITSGKLDEISLIENVQRENLNPLEEAEALKKMIERHGYTQAELGKVIGKKQNSVSELLKLTSLPQTIKDEYVKSGAISKSALIELSRVESKKEQLQVWNEVKQGGLTVRAARSKKTSKGRPRVSKAEPSSVASLLKSGRRFVEELHKTQLPDLGADNKPYEELLELRKEISEQIEKLLKQAT